MATDVKGPTRRRVALPTSGRWPRVGKIRLGTAEPTGKTTDWGQAIVRPQKADHFVVHADESGITSEEAARAFADAYGSAPTQLRFILPGDTPDDCMEGAYRLYGANKLKIRCDGLLCDERTATGWRRDQPCICQAKGKVDCTLTYTIQLILPDVAVPGIWQLDTGSEISSRRMADWLDMVYTLRGGLLGVEGDLFLKSVSVQPEGMQKTTTVYVLSPQAREATVTQLLAGGGGVHLGPGRRAELPAPAADDEPEPTLDRPGFEESRPAASSEAAAAHRDAGDTVQSPDAPGGAGTVEAASVPDAPVDATAPGGARGDESPATDWLAGKVEQIKHVEQQIRSFDQPQRDRVMARCAEWGVDPTIGKAARAFIGRYGDETRDLAALLDQVDALDEAGKLA
jgi:hypothetical protein